ncbi:DUF1254 domain-containing protein [Rhizobium sp. LC145]|uniref:DUF1254 domain-containing protein n=1 Tax=Rhizobium sp. LC145 TaxID=1120688 RepID=UPI000629FC4D|nr:DUF1254 domain-containing protein [Rhizobium sp. LC145]KKX28084.1 membrane protein [Rhizobium sp. LC145]TKT43348.1 DUF1254 domain-containing protein [Rhizobiaceae bacterium LC148]
MLRSFAFKLALAIATGLIGAALLHLVIVLSLPYFSERDAYTRVLAKGERHRFYPLAEKPDQAGLAKDDPFLEVAVCSFDIGSGPIRVMAPGNVPFWSLAVYDGASNEVFSINDRTSVGGMLDVVIATPVQLTLLRKSLPEPIAESILVETQAAEGYIVLRSMVPQPSFAAPARQFLAQATCAPFEWRARNQF